MVSFQFYYHYYYVFLYAMASTNSVRRQSTCNFFDSFLIRWETLKGYGILFNAGSNWMSWMIDYNCCPYFCDRTCAKRCFISSRRFVERFSVVCGKKGKNKWNSRWKFMVNVDSYLFCCDECLLCQQIYIEIIKRCAIIGALFIVLGVFLYAWKNIKFKLMICLDFGDICMIQFK